MRWLIRATMALILAVAVGLVGLAFLPQERIARIAADQIRAQTGRDVEISAPLSISIWPVLGVATGPVTIANAPWAGDAPMLEARALSIAVDAPALLRGDIRVKRVRAQAPVLRLTKRADGRANWDFAATGAGGQGAPLPVLERLELKRARLIYSAPNQPPIDLDEVDLLLNWPDPGGIADLAVALGPAGARIKLAARTPDLAAFLHGQVARITADISAPGGTLRFVGRASTQGKAAGRVDLRAEDTALLARTAGLDSPAISSGLGRSAALRADLTYTADGRIALRDLALDLDGNRMYGAADIETAGKPRFNARLSGGALAYRGAVGGAAPNAPGWSTDAIDAGALGLADGTLTFSATSLSLPQTQLGAVQGTLRLVRARAVLEFTHLEAFGGQITGQLVANNRNGLSVGGKLRATNLGVSRLLGDLIGTERLTGPVSGRLEFLGVGQSVAAIMASLSGKGQIDMGQGRITGFDLDALMAGDETPRGTTVFDRLTASFTISEGNLRNDDLTMSLPNFQVTGAGRVGLAARDVDYLLAPRALRAGLAVPLRIKGPWDAPRLHPELDGLFKDKAKAKIETVRAEAKARARQKIAEELETESTDETALRETAKTRLKTQVRGEVLKLLGAD